VAKVKVVDVPETWLSRARPAQTDEGEEAHVYELTTHALVRFCERYRPDLDPIGDEAREALEKLTRNGTLVGPTVGGELYSAAYQGDVVPFVVRHDPKVRRPVVVTVLPRGRVGMAQDEVEDVVAAYLRLQNAHKPTPAKQEASPDKVSGVAQAWIGYEVARLKLAGKPPSALANEVHALRVEAQDLRARNTHLERKLAEARRENTRRPCADSKLRAHLEHTQAELIRHKVALRTFLRALTADMDDPDAAIDAALEAVRALEPGYLTRAYLSDEQLTKSERKRVLAEDLAALLDDEEEDRADAAE
jgi:hypothetical protein